MVKLSAQRILLNPGFKIPVFIRIFFVFVFPVCMQACNNTVEIQPQGKDNFFSFQTYFMSEAHMHQQRKTKIKKSITRSGNEEIKMINSPDWESELRLFIDADLKKAAWVNLYQIDTLWNDSVVSVFYQSKDRSLQVKQATIILKRSQVDEIRISSSFKNFYYRSNLELVYQAGIRYEIRGSQAIRFANSQDFLISCEFLN